LSAAISVTLPRPLGRPFDESKRAIIVDAARSAFFDFGYSGTSIEEIARRAGVSKVTVYNRFGDKQALFVAAVERECTDMETSLRLDIDWPDTLRAQLVRYGEAMLAFLNRPKLIRFDNMLSGEMERHPELGLLFLNAGPRRMMHGLVSVIKGGIAREEIAVADPQMAAELMGGMFKGFADLERRYNGDESQTNEARWVEYAVDCFLAAHPPEPKAG
jgi:TetR/AcrR family transcriptional regulator, mexJK operon transcriptional repressor